MGSRGRLLFDLNEPPPEDDVDDNVDCFQPRKVIPSSSSAATSLFVTSTGSQGIVNNHAFSHASSVSGFQPFSRAKVGQGSDNPEKGSFADKLSDCAPSSKPSGGHDLKAAPKVQSVSVDAQDIEKEEGEWSDADGSVDACRNVVHVDSKDAPDKQVLHKGIGQMMGSNELDGGAENVSLDPHDVKNVNDIPQLEVNHITDDKKDVTSIDGPEDSAPVPRQKEIKGIEASHGLRSTSILGKRPKFDQKKEAMLGKKRNRQTVLINIEDVKQVGALKTPRRQLPAPTITRTVKETRSSMPPTEHGDKHSRPVTRDIKQADPSSNGNNNFLELNEDCESNVDDNSNGPFGGSSKLPPDTRHHKNVQFSGRKPTFSSQNTTDPKLTLKKLPSKKQANISNQYQDTSVERLLREVTNDKFWHHSEEELQCVPGRFDSVEEYINVFEPLLFEECRAQLYSTWEESLETASSHVRVGIRNIERRERGWFDVILIPAHEHKWTFKEGDVAVLSSPKPGSAHTRRDNNSIFEGEEKPEVIGRVAGTVRRYMPIDTREHSGAIFHFYVGDLSDSSSKIDDDHILWKLHPGDVWYLTGLGSVATTQREYVALHAFRRLDLQMQNAILQPSPEQFPKYEEHTPAMPDCFTPNFGEHLHKTFNRPQLAAIQWAAMHTAAGTSNGLTKKQDLWPFTLVQGPPGTGKTHTVWGMLNVIHLVQYQHYYTALLKKLAPESYKQVNETTSDNVAVGSIDEVLQSMDQNLLRTLPKLCPKPRMLVCAPSNAATDELLARVLDRGFIDGEMKVYRPDVARVGVDSQTRAAQTVSVERRTDQLLIKSRDEVLGWMHNLRLRETQLSQQIACLQRDLNVAAANGRAQGSVGVDPDVLMARDQNRDSLLQQLAAVVENRDKILVEMSRLFMLEGKFRPGSNFNLEEARANLEASFANEAEIVFTTVSSSGRKLFSRLTHGFDMVVIDEAAQASEVGILPPLSLGASRCVLVGDPQQLPATVISKAAGTLMYSRSLFERFQQAGCPTMLLSVQYRMHPQIRDFPSRYFYEGRLTDSESITSLPDEIYYKDPLLRPYIFFDIAYGRESHRGGSVSYQNTQEAHFCVRLYEYLQKLIKPLGGEKVSVGVITPYKLQLRCLQWEFKDVMNTDDGKDIYINTVDAFQGQERDVIIMSCVRASSRGVGFVSDIRRMNVALTRARRALWIMGNANALAQSDDWAALIEDAKARKCYLTMDSLPKDFLPEPSTQATFSAKFSGSRSLRSGRYRQQDLHVESRSGTQSEEDEKPNKPIFPKNGFRNLRSGADNLLNDINQSRERSRDAWQHGTQKKQNTAGVLGKKDL